MKSIFLIFLLVAGNGVLFGQPPTKHSTGDGSGAWKVFESEEFEFSALFPNAPKEKATDLQAKAGVRTAHWFSVEEGGIKYEISCTEYLRLPKMDKGALKKNYDLNRDSMLKETGAILIDESDAALGKHLGRELVLKIGDEVVIDRMFTIDQRLYQLVVTIWASDFK